MLTGNEHIKRLTEAMITKGREPHSIIITGERGQGRRTAAKYIAASMLCEKNNGRPCGVCKSCRMIRDGIHPDFMTAQPNENGNYPVEQIREIVSNAVVAPNEGRVKVYLIPELERSIITGEQVQNILLKLIEEPPDHVVMILTADSKEAFLQTILSRAIALSVVPCTKEECISYLGTLGKYEYDEIAGACDALGGNIGSCIEYLEKQSIFFAVQNARAISAALVSGDEYELLRVLNETDSKKGQLRETLRLLSEILRDGAVASYGGVLTSCSNKNARALSQRYGSGRCSKLYRCVSEHMTKLDRNCSKALVINSLCAGLSVI